MKTSYSFVRADTVQITGNSHFIFIITVERPAATLKLDHSVASESDQMKGLLFTTRKKERKRERNRENMHK